MVSEPRGYAWLHELAADPDRLKPPRALLPRLAWQGRTTLLSGAEKAGKSEFVSQEISAGTRRDVFLGDECGLITCLWLCLDEPEEDLVRRLMALGADPHRIAIRTTRPENPVHLAELMRETGANVTVVDSLMSFVSGLVTRGGDAAEWTPHLKGLTAVARSAGAAMIWLHHANKATGNYRDSSAIGAEADMILEFQPHQHGDTVRKIRVRGRLPLRDFDLDFVDGRYVLAGEASANPAPGKATEHTRTLLELLSDAEPEGFTSSGWMKAADLPKTSYNRARRRLLREGLAIGPEDTRTNKYRITEAGERALMVPGARGANEVPRNLGTTGLDGAKGATPMVMGGTGTRPGTSDRYESEERMAIVGEAA